ncbi:UDP-N-acetylglucosamine transporter isoform X2 [Neocloeon triangulifer]|uniref:UDP-N-acetylglucosamine transporter isoform X2 n=1 Tax=Neocloeon triangulifer TaxID=2078957 RepID=UPI00286FA2F1|nr:UDP-N-acetylglucosamine transporter isoform X2 [Neocloeon triangulifer]
MWQRKSDKMNNIESPLVHLINNRDSHKINVTNDDTGELLEKINASGQMSTSAHASAKWLGYVSLMVLTLQNATLGISMSYARRREGDMFLSSSAVLSAEVVKLITCLILVFKEEKTYDRWKHSLHKTIILNPIDTLKVCVPSLIYIVQNNLLYVSATHLDVGTYQVTYQLKILTTAFFAVLILHRSLSRIQWSSLLVLIAGVVLVQLAHVEEAKLNHLEQNRLVGLISAVSACFCSGFAGIYFEKILKGSVISVWMRNVQLSLLSIPFGLITCVLSDGEAIREKGFFVGYDGFILFLIALQALGGLIIAMVVKYADNILKGFATSLAIVISCIASIFLFDFVVTGQFAFGAFLVMFSIFMYSYKV